MFRVILLTLPLIISVDGYASYNFDQLNSYVNKNLKCLENKILSPNATFQVALGQAFLEFIHKSVPDLPSEKLKIVNNIQKRIENIVEDGMRRYPDDPTNKIWRSKYYANTGNFTFKRELVPKDGTLDVSLEDIIRESIPNEFSQDCFNKIFSLNEASPVRRECIDPCESVMKAVEYNPDVPFDAKAWHIGYEMVLNCTAFNSEEYKDREVEFCNHLKKEVNTMLLHEDSWLFFATRHYFMSKVAICGSWGIPEFLTMNIITSVVNYMDCHGCVHGPTKTADETNVLTAQTMAILVAAMRLTAEIEADTNKFL